MAINFPTSLDTQVGNAPGAPTTTKTNTGGEAGSSAHSTCHNDLSAAVVALETAVGITGASISTLFATTTANFTMVGYGVNTASIAVTTSSWMATGQVLIVGTGSTWNYMAVASSADSTHVVLTNLAGALTSGTVNSGAIIQPAGFPVAVAGQIGGVPSTDVQIFTTPGAISWVKPTIGNPKATEIICIGAGGGGGSGAYNTGTLIVGGGGGGGGGAFSSVVVPTSALGGTVSGHVGSGGTAGAAISASGTAGNAGQTYANATHDSWFGSSTYNGTNVCYAQGGSPGTGGSLTTTAAGGGGGANGLNPGCAGGTGNDTTGGGATTQTQALNGAGGGGGGAGMAAAGAETLGGAGSNYPLYLGISVGGGSAGGTHAAGGNGGTATGYLPGGGGGGGGSSKTAGTRSGGGGTGGLYGAGGGGGGGAAATSNATGSGAGGPGGNGCVIVITYF